ncbi:thioredoxin-like protein [Cubamyces sp. BRFM 1775]|nr:thioredoxin-like protein [Cubamyces sp. BRFM 1775]
MVQNGQITLYSSPYSPFTHRVRIALDQANADYTQFVIDFTNKPSWYAEKINPVGKVPAITYGGPKSTPENPPTESAKINESLVILELLADLFPEANLLPSDPILRAQARLFINVFESKAFDGFKDFCFIYVKGSDKTLLDGLEALQARLPPTGFAVGPEWTNADSAVAPFLVRLDLMLKHDIGCYPQEEGAAVLEALRGARFARLTKYIDDIMQSPVFKPTWDEEMNLKLIKLNPAVQRK